ncbi:MAG: hypothetical protein KatS3mg082_1998 [Nitrospiraceae bacterium]|nr:MAG: hypothetical protein KatS3mg082_1998 [Nitrospiraceae bacterium]
MPGQMRMFRWKRNGSWFRSRWGRWPDLEPDIRQQIESRAAELEKSHKRVRQAVSLKVRQLSLAPQFPPDLLGILVLQPVVGEERETGRSVRA